MKLSRANLFETNPSDSNSDSNLYPSTWLRRFLESPLAAPICTAVAVMLATLTMAIAISAIEPAWGAPMAPSYNGNGSGSASPVSLRLDGSAYTVNVMGRTKPATPAFPALTAKPGVVRGFVLNSEGKPVVGAKLGVRSTMVGGFYSGAQGKTDSRGYYEIKVPTGAAHFYSAGFVADYGDGIAALGLHPADGELDSFATAKGHVENFVLLPFGVADRAGAQENPRYSGNYYGGTMVLSWYIADERFATAESKELPNNATFTLTLTPTGPLVDGSAARPITIERTVTESGPSQLYVNNIPVGEYKISARLSTGSPLRMTEIGPTAGQAFGMNPRTTADTATLLLRPSTAKAEMATAGKGNWEHVSLKIERP